MPPVKRKEFESVFPKSRAAWRQWLEKNHRQSESIWLIIPKKESGLQGVTVDEAVEEALCFGWVDSLPNKVDDKRFKLLLSPRKPKSNWSKVNKDRVEKLIAAGLMTEAGLKIIEEAKRNGKWEALDKITALELPNDLKKAFSKNKKARDHFNAFPPSTKRGILEWILNAKKEETRQKRIAETVRLAEQNIRANQYVK